MRSHEIIVFFDGQARGVAADFERGRFLELVLVLDSVRRDDLPAAAQADLLGSHGDPDYASAIKTSVFVLPTSLTNPSTSVIFR